MAEITFEDYLKGRSREEMMRSRQRLMDDFKEFKRRRKVMEQRQMAKSGKMIKASEGKMTESDLQKKVDRDAKINKARKSLLKIGLKEFIKESPFETEMAGIERKEQMERARKRTKEKMEKMKGLSKGGMCRGMGAALRGGDFKGVK